MFYHLFRIYPFPGAVKDGGEIEGNPENLIKKMQV